MRELFFDSIIDPSQANCATSIYEPGMETQMYCPLTAHWTRP